MNPKLDCFATKILVSTVLFLGATHALAQSPAPQTCSNVAAPATTPSSEFTILGDGSSIRHEASGLEWRRCSIGQNWDGTTCQANTTFHTWKQTLDIAASAAGDWRLPNIQELRSIVERCRESPAINRQAFPATPSSYFWSASPDAGNLDRAWGINFADGNDAQGGKGSAVRVRLVRGGQ